LVSDTYGKSLFYLEQLLMLICYILIIKPTRCSNFSN